MVLEQFIIDADIIWDQVGKTFFENPEAKPGRIMRVQVVNAGIIEDLTGYTLNLGWTSVKDPSKFGLDAFDDVDITKGIFEIDYTSEMLTNVGPLNAALQLVPPGEGRPVESNNFKLTVKNSAINAEAIQGENSFSTLETALVKVNGWNARIDAVEADFIQRANDMEEAYPQELNSLSSQLEQAELNKVDKGGAEQVTFAMLSQDTKTAMTGGSVAVVGVDGVGKPNTVPNSITKNKLSIAMQNIFLDEFTERTMTFTDVGFYNATNVLNNTTGYHKESVPVTPGEIYRISGYAFQQMSLFILAKSDGTSVEKYPLTFDDPQVYYSNVLVTIPNNVSFLYVNQRDSQVLPVKVEVASTHLVNGALIKNRAVIEGKQLYDISMNVPGKWLNSSGAIATSSTSKYAKIPVEANQTISLCRKDARSFDWGQSGSLIYFDSIGNILSYVNPVTLLNASLYNAWTYITFETPDNCAYIGYTSKLSTTYDLTGQLLVVYGDKITDEVLEHNLLTNFNGYEIKDKVARNNTKSYDGVKLIVIGDSLTAQSIRTTKNYHNYLSDELGFTVINMGHSGTGYKKTDELGTAFYQRVLNAPIDGVVSTVFGSFNDLSSGAPLGTPTDTGTATICGCMNTFFDNYYSVLPTVPIGVVTPTPWIGSYPGIATADAYVDALLAICKKRSIPHLDLYHGSNLRPWDAEFRTLAYSKDDGNGVHPDEVGNKIFYPSYREFVKSLI